MDAMCVNVKLVLPSCVLCIVKMASEETETVAKFVNVSSVHL
jgi:hypothetical protein